jgi:hypothetical protein
MPATAQYKTLPFDEAIKFFKQKVKLPTQKWTDLTGGMHSRAFVVAGAMKTGLLEDLYSAVDQGIQGKMSLADFRKAFDKTVQKHGWTYKGERGWRTATIYNTNLRTAHTVGRYQQMTDPDVQQGFPYWRFRTLDGGNRRPLHQSWKNIILPSNDPWWDTHAVPLGFGCKCWIEPVSRRDYNSMKGSTGVKTTAPDDGSYSWTNPSTGVTEQIPNGIDPGWNYNPGKTAWGDREAEAAMAGKTRRYETLTPGDWQTHGRPERIPIDTAAATLGPEAKTQSELYSAIEKTFGGPEKTFSYKVGDFEDRLVVDAKVLARHIQLWRAPYIPLMQDLMADPYEIWMSFDRDLDTGKVHLRQRIIKAVEGKKGGLVSVFEAEKNRLVSWTFVPSTVNYPQNQRHGKLVWARE